MNLNQIVQANDNTTVSDGRKKLMETLSNMKIDADDEGVVIQFPSGYTQFDAKTAQVLPGVQGWLVLNYGMAPRLQGIVGVSDVGKTTWAIQLSAATVGRFSKSMFHFLDLEDNSDVSRIQGLTHWDNIKMGNHVQYSGGIRTMRQVLDILRAHAESKKKDPKDCKFSTGLVDPFTGETIDAYIPSVILLDSLGKLSDAEDDDDIENMSLDKGGSLKATDQLGQNTDGMRKALKLQKFVEKVKNYLSKYNIVLICIAHKTQAIQMSMFDRPDKYHALMKPGEKLKANRDFIYQCYRISDMTAGVQIGPPIPARPKREPMYGDSVSGIITYTRLIKNKSNVNNTMYTTVHDATRGNIDFLSDIEYLLDKEGANTWGVSGSPLGYTLDVYPVDPEGKPVVWKRKTVYDMAMRDPILLQSIKFTAFIHSMYSSALRPYAERGSLFPVPLESILPTMRTLPMILDQDMFVSMLFIFADTYPSMDRVVNANRKMFNNVILPLYNSGYAKWINLLPKEIIDSPVGIPIMPYSLVQLSKQFIIKDEKKMIVEPKYTYNTQPAKVVTQEPIYKTVDRYAGEMVFAKTVKKSDLK